MRFVGLELHEPVPGAKTMWLYRGELNTAGAHDSRSLPELLDAENTASGVWADTAYRTRRNLDAVPRRGLRERIQFRRPRCLRLSAPRAKANAARARVRSAVEHVFARQKH